MVEYVRLRLPFTLGSQELDLVEDRAAILLSEVGLSLEYPEVLRRLEVYPFVRVAGSRVCFDREYVYNVLYAQRYHPTESDHISLRVSAGGGALAVLDHRSGALRPPVTDDLIQILHVCDHLGLDGDPPVIPVDIPIPLREIALYRLVWEHTSRFTGRDITSVRSGEYIYEMAQVASKRLSLSLYVVSPMTINPEALTLVLHFAERPLVDLAVGTMPMPGATAPLLGAGYLAQMLAEMVGGYLVLSLLVPGKRIPFGGTPVAFDFFTNTIACGSPEALLQGQLQVALCARYGLIPQHFFWSMAAGPDPQAAAERIAGVLLGALAGVRSFGVAGRLQGEAFSLEQLLIDLEVASYVERILSGQAWDSLEFDWFAEAQAAIQEGSFLASPSTVAFYRSETWRGTLFTHYTLAQRMALNEPPLRERVRAQIEDLLEMPVPEHLPREKCLEFARIYSHAEAHLV